MIAPRKANAADASQIAATHVRSWQAVYRGFMPDEFLDRLDVAERAESWRNAIASSSADVLVIDDAGGRLAGFCSLIRSRDPDASATTGEIAALYVDPERCRVGLGTMLLRDALTLAPERGFATLTLWVLEGNAGARQFYERHGFRPDGSMKTESRWGGGFSVREVRYGMPVGAGAT
jgi:GNAT superfamily N-acetyltransferase